MQTTAVDASEAAEHTERLSQLAADASGLGHEVVEIAGVLDQIDDDARQQLQTIALVGKQADGLLDGNKAVQRAASDVERTCAAGREILDQSVTQVRDAIDRSQAVARWVAEIEGSMSSVMETLRDVEVTNTAIAGISRQVNILAINAKIEAARAGDAGRGFAVVAEAINELSRKTADSASRISDAIGALTSSVEGIHAQSSEISGDAENVLADGSRTDKALTEISEQVDETTDATHRILREAERVGAALEGFGPAFNEISQAAQNTASGIEALHKRSEAMIDTSERLLQGSVEAGGVAIDALFIDDVQRRAAAIGDRFAAALRNGEISQNDLFSRDYVPIPNTDPAQLMAPFTAFTDKVLPNFQEDALALDRRVVFCAAVDLNGYLPSHNLKFSQPQGDDPVWNAANSRNRRLFNDRVGLKAGRNQRPFLLQVYRRDMGGGAFAMMKDVSAPIIVDGRQWGGLRLAFRHD